MDDNLSKNNESKIDVNTVLQQKIKKCNNITDKNVDLLASQTFSPENDSDEKAKSCHLIKTEDGYYEPMDECSSDVGGRLTFFREGKPLLELSHRADHGSWVQVKSKTYWPPSTTAKTTTQLKNGSYLWSADECSSTSSALNGHCRKSLPKRVTTSNNDFYWHSAMSSDEHRLRQSRNPFIVLCLKNYHSQKTYRKRTRCTLKAKLLSICEKLGCNIESSLNITSLCEKWKACQSDSVVQSPRKRLIKQVNGEKEGHLRKKPYSGAPPISHKTCDRVAGSSTQFPIKGPSAHSIESLLNNDSGHKNESFLRNLLKTDSKEVQQHVLKNYSGHEEHRSSMPKNWFENNGSDGRSSKNVPPEFNNLRKAGPAALGNFYLPYLNPGYMVMPPYYPTAQRTAEVASMVAAAAMNLQGLQNSPMMASASMEASFRAANVPMSPQPRVPSRSSDSPQPRTVNRASPSSPQSRALSRVTDSPQTRTQNRASSPHPRTSNLACSHPISPNCKNSHPFNSNLGSNVSSYISLLNSPPLPWVPSVSNSPPNASNSAAVSPPPQDVPLNLSKRQEEG